MVKCSVEICLQTHENDEENRRRTADFSGDVMLQYTLLVFSFFSLNKFFHKPAACAYRIFQTVDGATIQF
jgi:hypothetical protein